jgi:putative phosphoesterase
VKRAIRALGEINLLVHLGDGAGDAEATGLKLPEFIQLKGNCDLFSELPREEIRHLSMNAKALFCHGDEWGVKWGLQLLVYRTQECEAQIACFGHTHHALVDYQDGIYLVNPGSCRGYDASCALIEVENGRVRPQIILLNR